MACNGENKKSHGKIVHVHTWGERTQFFSCVMKAGQGLMMYQKT